MAFILESSAFRGGEKIPRKYAAEGDNLSPPLRWTNPPAETRSHILLVEDPDAPKGTFRHWAAYNVPRNATGLPEGSGNHDGSYDAGVNDYAHTAYDGPNPPPGHGLHHYHFRLAALDVDRLDVPRTARAEEVWRAAEPHILEETELVGTYEC